VEVLGGGLWIQWGRRCFLLDGGWGVGENVLNTLRKEKGRGQRDHRAIARLFGRVETGSGAFNSHGIVKVTS
jgi:hypothetical protein